MVSVFFCPKVGSALMPSSAFAAGFAAGVADGGGSSGPLVPQPESAKARPKPSASVLNDRFDADTGSYSSFKFGGIIAIKRCGAKPAPVIFPD